ncbi:hypothetical protein C8R47DRAFT_1215350 [Mycena vitilis]|nr:hypothetical protein C8R47DRAFT_1215350 [Mycena vitilis]
MADPNEVAPLPRFLGDHEYLQDFWPGNEYSITGTPDFVTPYETLDGSFSARIIGRVHDIVQVGARRTLLVLTKPTGPAAAQDMFSDAYTIADYIICHDREDVSRIIVMETHWCAGNTILVSLNNRSEGADVVHAGELVTCEVILRREERQAPWSTMSCRLYSRVYRMLALSVEVQVLA